jgi:hypothetical protein
MDLITHLAALPTDSLMDYSNFCNGLDSYSAGNITVVQNVAVSSIKGFQNFQKGRGVPLIRY